MKRHLCALALALPLALASCSGDNAAEKNAETPAGSGNTGAVASASPGSTGNAQPTDPAQQVGPSRTQGAPVPGDDQGDVKITSCEAGGSGVEVEATVTNSTKETRTYIVTAMVYDKDKKVAGSAALMTDGIAAGKSKEATGKTNKAIKGKVTCEVAQIDSMVTG